MTFKQARKQLETIANGRYYSLRFELRKHPHGAVSTECSVYVDGSEIYSGNTWDEAFVKLENHTQNVTETIPDVDDLEF